MEPCLCVKEVKKYVNAPLYILYIYIYIYIYDISLTVTEINRTSVDNCRYLTNLDNSTERVKKAC